MEENELKEPGNEDALMPPSAVREEGSKGSRKCEPDLVGWSEDEPPKKTYKIIYRKTFPQETSRIWCCTKPVSKMTYLFTKRHTKFPRSIGRQ